MCRRVDVAARPMRGLLLALALPAVAAPCIAQAQSDEQARCERLYAQYERYSNTGGEGRTGSSAAAGLEARSALESCRRGNTAEGIAVLERRLRALGFRV